LLKFNCEIKDESETHINFMFKKLILINFTSI